MTGAGRLAARAALRVGAGLVTVAAPSEALPIYAQASASLITTPLDAPPALEALLADARRNAVLVGPGAGLGESTRDQTLAALAAGKATVLDAGALSVFAEAPGDLLSAIEGPCVMTPHDGEFARLFPDLAEEGGSKLTRPGRRLPAAARWSCSKERTVSSRRRTAARPSTPTRRRSWPPPAAATSWPAS